MAPIRVMKTVDKALALLEHFSAATPEFGLTELSRAAGLDKATTLRLASSLRKHGFLEQDPVSKRFHLGTALLHYARVREDCYPMVRVLRPVLERLAAAAGETAHTALIVGESFNSVISAEPDRSTRVKIEHDRVPLHATASGVALLAFSGPEMLERALSQGLDVFTARTPATPEALRARLDQTRRRGYSLSPGALESDVVSLGAPLFGPIGVPVGTVTVACVASRWAAARERPLAGLVTAAAIEASRLIGGAPPAAFLETIEGLAGQM